MEAEFMPVEQRFDAGTVVVNQFATFADSIGVESGVADEIDFPRRQGDDVSDRAAEVVIVGGRCESSGRWIRQALTLQPRSPWPPVGNIAP
jgi:hypothetical protein